MKIIGALLFLTACQTTPEPQCIRGIVWLQSSSGLAWVPDVHGRPVSCVDFFMEPELVPEYPVPEGVK